MSPESLLSQGNVEKSRLQWRCRRGMLELDLLLLPFVENVYDLLSKDERHRFHLLLDLQDQELLECLMLQKSPEDESLNDIISKVRSSV
ncbi:succinate dehydrogenase assembly factor 2 [Pseudomonadota bacterium]